MRHRVVWPFAALLTLALAACSIGPAPTPEPNTPTPRARTEQIAQATEVAAQITATAVARAQPTNTPTPRATIPPRPTLPPGKGNGKPLKATPVEFSAVPLADGRRYRDASGFFAVTIPQEWEAYPQEEDLILAVFIAPEDNGEVPVGLSVIMLSLPPAYESLPLSDITNEALAEVRSVLNKDYTFVRLERIETNDIQIDRIISRDTSGDGYYVQTFLVVEQILHVLTFYSPGDQFEANMPVFDSVLASYSWIEK
jgi:hypothetical protein